MRFLEAERLTQRHGAYIVPRWASVELRQMNSHAIEGWLHATFQSWWTMHGVRGIMSRVFHYAAGHGLWEPGQSNPAAQAKLGTKRCTYERRILTLEETSRVLTRLDDPNLLIIETCIATGARISEVLGLKWKHVNYDASTIRIEQRLWAPRNWIEPSLKEAEEFWGSETCPLLLS